MRNELGRYSPRVSGSLIVIRLEGSGLALSIVLAKPFRRLAAATIETSG
jgi:hypothetical protein